MADEQWKKSNFVYGSAGMAASGMMPAPAEKPKEEVKARFSDPDYQAETEDTEELLPDEGEVVAEETAEVADPADETQNEAETEAVPAPEEPSPLIREDVVKVKPSLPGYGINSKAQGLFADLNVALIGSGSRQVGGFDWDPIFQGIDGIRVAGVSNPNADALEGMRSFHNHEVGYSDYRELLARHKPHLAVVAEPDTIKKYEMIKSCLMSGAHVICPPPFAQTLDDADELIALADRRGLKLAVAHPDRLDPNLIRFHKGVEETIGELVEIRISGSMNELSGGYDLLLHGTPLFDLARMFAGKPLWCTAAITSRGSRSQRENITVDPEIGPLVGDSIHAQFMMDSDVLVTYSSDHRLKDVSGGRGIEFIGSKNVMRLYGGEQPALSLRENPEDGQKPESTERWGYWPELRDPYFVEVDGLFGRQAALRLVVGDWLESIAKDHQSECSPMRATKAMEMSHAIFQSGITGRKVYFPMANRHHPLVPEMNQNEFPPFKESA